MIKIPLADPLIVELAFRKTFDIRILSAVLITVNSGKIVILLASSNQPQDIVSALFHHEKKRL